ncbi:MAG: hypothetical protein F6J95_023130 [Leptolyngbya sp. SIO1E4]|nr:hypothetical protein [Leptolyngbya sp. SIO1E4]
MLKLFNLERNVSSLIKVFSTILITGALGLELGNLAATFMGGGPISGLDPVFWIGRVALVIHGVEGAIAAVYAPSRQRSPLTHSIYTFFVGTVGLVELLRQPAVACDRSQ